MTYIPTNLYEVRIYDSAGAFKLIPQRLTRIEYKQRLNAPWNHQLTFEMSKDDPNVIKLREIDKDWFIKIFRTDPFTQLRQVVYSGFHITLVDQARTSGDLIFNLYGSGFTQLLSRRVVEPTPDEENNTKTGPAETVLKSYVSDCMISPVNPDFSLNTDRVFPGVSLEPDSAGGETVEYSARYINLLTVCENVANAGKLDFGVIEGNNLGEFIVRARPLWGKDRRVGNPDGNKPTLFNFLRGTMNIPILSINASDEKNYVYVGGPNTGVERIIQPVTDPASIAQSPWGRKEVFVEARQQETINALIAIGQSEIENRKLKRELSFEIIQREGTRWLVDWELGDLTTAQYFDYRVDKKIVEVGVLVSGEASAELNEVFTVELADVRL